MFINEPMKIKGVDVLVEYNMRALLMYKKFSGQSFNPDNLEGLCKLLYCCVVIGTSDFDITYEEFIDELGKFQSPYVVLSEFIDFINAMKEV